MIDHVSACCAPQRRPRPPPQRRQRPLDLRIPIHDKPSRRVLPFFVHHNRFDGLQGKRTQPCSAQPPLGLQLSRTGQGGRRADLLACVHVQAPSKRHLKRHLLHCRKQSAAAAGGPLPSWSRRGEREEAPLWLRAGRGSLDFSPGRLDRGGDKEGSVGQALRSAFAASSTSRHPPWPRQP